MTIREVEGELAFLADSRNARRNDVLIPGSLPVLGAKVPELRKLAKKIAKEDYEAFLLECESKTYEHQMLKAFTIGYAKDSVEKILGYADAFIPEIADWSVNDAFCQTFSIAKQEPEMVWEWLKGYATKNEEYAQRVVAVMCLSHFLTKDYIKKVLRLMDRLGHEGYYAKMGVAWCVATAYAKFPKETFAYLENNKLSDWTFNKSIQKMMESFRVPKEDKVILRNMKRR